MENKDKAISLFKYIMELYAQKYQIISNIERQEWRKFVSDIPKDDDNIIFNYMDRTVEDDESYSVSTILLQVKKPEFEKAPSLPIELNGWVNDEWDRYNQPLVKIDTKPIKHSEIESNQNLEDSQMSLDSNLDVEQFDDDSSRMDAFDSFKKERDIWVARQIKINVTRKLFNDLHLTYIDLERDSEVIELMIGQGMMLCEMSEYNKTNHPILLKKVAMEFDSLHNIIKIVDTEYSPEIYTMLLQGIDFINHSAVKTIKEQLSQDFYHPLDRNDTPDFLKSLTHRLHAESSYLESINDNHNSEDKLIVINNPVFFVRKRTGGVIKAIEEIISELEETGKISGPLLNLIGEVTPQFGEKEEILDANYSLDMNNSLSALSGEDKDILLSKEANREQLEIAKRIENYNAVLVQGPPGTGKTHTIANLMGHFLAQGKNILVTSHTKKALSVVKEKVAPELQDLCVSVLDDNSSDMERSIDGITEYISSHSSLELLENIDVLKRRREKISTDLDDVRKNIFSVKYKEFESIVFGGESFSPAAAAKYVWEHSENLSSIIPGKVLLGKPFPITSSDLALLYKTNTAVSVNDEQELSADLPDPNLLPTSAEFAALVADEEHFVNETKHLAQGYPMEINYSDCSVQYNNKALCYDFDLANLKQLKNLLSKTSMNLENLDNWCSYCILDGKKGSGHKAAWELLIEKIETTYRYASDNVMLFLGKKIKGDFEKSEATIRILNEMQEHFQRCGSLSLLGSKNWMSIYESIIKDGNFIYAPQQELVLGQVIDGEIEKTELTISLLNEMKGYLISGKKLNSFALFKPQNWKSWMAIYNAIKLNGLPISKPQDCDILIAFCQIELHKSSIKQSWNNLIERQSGIDFDSLEANYEQNAVAYIENLQCWERLYSAVKINDSNIATPTDFDILRGACTLEIKRHEVASLWHELIEKHGGISFDTFGAKPEEIAVSHVQKIRTCASWYNTTYEEIKQNIYEAKLNDVILSEKQDYVTALDEIKQLVQVLYTDIPNFIDITVNVYDKLFSISNKFQKVQSIFNAKHSEGSAVCQNIMSAIVLKNAELYKNYYNELTALHQKYHYSNERKRILEQIRNYAPDWAELLNNRVGIHGEDIQPENIEEAWKWKQLAGAIDQITALPFEALQHKSVSLANELRTATAQLAEKLAWQHLLARIEKDISQKQALQGWKLTVKKIGKGTGKAAPALRREAQKLMVKCQTAVPAWIMPINKALESLDPKTNKFDIVIIDEASQSDISALAIIYLAKKIIIVGDDEQVSPSAVGIDVDKMRNLANMFIKDIIPNAHLYDMKSSLYDIAKTTFPTLMLKEHFRCVPDIIGYSNRLSYDYKIKPLRDESNVAIKPATISYRVKNGIRNGRKVNQKEAETVVALMLACMEFEEYNSMTFGAISLLGDEQAKYIQALALKKISPLDYEKRRILCGNASHFQGDERDVIFISLVDNNEKEGPLRLTNEGQGKSTKQRYNVAVSRAKNQLWVVHSLDVLSDLKPGDMRRDLIEYVTNPTAFEEQTRLITAKADSPFEVSVAKALVLNGYHIVQQWKVGSYSIDMVALFGGKKIAIECDGELYHSGDEKIRQDMERQTILERLGWRFIRIRGSEYYRDQESTIKRVISELKTYGIEPEAKDVIIDDYSKLKNDVIIRAEQMLQEWHQKDDEIEVNILESVTVTDIQCAPKQTPFTLQKSENEFNSPNPEQQLTPINAEEFVFNQEYGRGQIVGRTINDKGVIYITVRFETCEKRYDEEIAFELKSLILL